MARSLIGERERNVGRSNVNEVLRLRPNVAELYRAQQTQAAESVSTDTAQEQGKLEPSLGPC